MKRRLLPPALVFQILQDDLAVIFDDEVDEVIDVPESEDQVYN